MNCFSSSLRFRPYYLVMSFLFDNGSHSSKHGSGEIFLVGRRIAHITTECTAHYLLPALMTSAYIPPGLSILPASALVFITPRDHTVLARQRSEPRTFHHHGIVHPSGGIYCMQCASPRLRTRIAQDMRNKKSKIVLFWKRDRPSRGNKRPILSRNIRSASVMPCNVSPHLNPRTPNLQFKLTRHDMTNNYSRALVGTGHRMDASKWSVPEHIHSCRCPHLFLPFSRARKAGTRAGLYRTDGPSRTSALGIDTLFSVSCWTSCWSGFGGGCG